MTDDDDRARARLRYGWAEIPRAAALVKALAVGDLLGIHRLGPTTEDLPQEPGPAVWLDPLDYPPDQAARDDHRLVFGLVALVFKLARECGISGPTLARAVDQLLSLPPDSG